MAIFYQTILPLFDTPANNVTNGRLVHANDFKQLTIQVQGFSEVLLRMRWFSLFVAQ